MPTRLDASPKASATFPLSRTVEAEERAALHPDLHLRTAWNRREDPQAFGLDLRDDGEVPDPVAQLAQHRHGGADDVEPISHRAAEGDHPRA